MFYVKGHKTLGNESELIIKNTSVYFKIIYQNDW